MKILTSTGEHDAVLVEFEGDVDAHTARQVDKTRDDLLAQGCSRLVLDASPTGFVASAGLRTIMSAQQQVCSRGGDVRVRELTAWARRTFEMARLGECLRLTDIGQEPMVGSDVAGDTPVLTAPNPTTHSAEPDEPETVSGKDPLCPQYPSGYRSDHLQTCCGFGEALLGNAREEDPPT